MHRWMDNFFFLKKRSDMNRRCLLYLLCKFIRSNVGRSNRVGKSHACLIFLVRWVPGEGGRSWSDFEAMLPGKKRK